MLHTLWRSLTEPVRTAGSLAILIGCSVSLWFLFTILLLLAEQAAFVPWMLGNSETWILALMAPPILALTLPMISGEARDRTLLLNLMLPVTRTGYYTGRVAGRALFAALYFAITLSGLYVIVSMLTGAIFRDGATSPMPPDLVFRFVFVGCTLISIVFSLCALAPVSSSRYGHVAYWAGLWIIVKLARDLHAVPQASTLERSFATVVLEVLQPFLIGADPRFVNEAALGSWYLWRVLLQWGFGMSLAYLIGIFAFSKMEVARRT